MMYLERAVERRKPFLAAQDAGPAQPSPDWMVLFRDRHRAERAARGRVAAKTKFGWIVCPFLGCVCSLKSEFAVKVGRVWSFEAGLCKGEP